MDSLPPKRSLLAQIQEIERLVAEQSDRVRSVRGFGAGIRKAEAQEHLHRLQAVRETLLWLQAHEAAIREALKPRFDIVEHLKRQRIWSERTFGPGERTQGVIEHITKELGEIEAAPQDIEEWVDVIILAFDGAWRAGWEPDAIVQAIEGKQSKNETRTWPDWRTCDPNKAIEHDRSFDGTARS